MTAAVVALLADGQVRLGAAAVLQLPARPPAAAPECAASRLQGCVPMRANQQLVERGLCCLASFCAMHFKFKR